MNKNTILTLVAMLATAVACQQAPKGVPAIDLANLDRTVAPSDDFYQFATGGWQKNHPLKPEYARYGSFEMLSENNEVRINELFESMTTLKTDEGSTERKICDLYKAGLDSARLNREGAVPVQADLHTILTAEKEQLPTLLGTLHRAVSDGFFGCFVEADLKNSDMNALYLSQGGLGMGDRDYYLEEENAALKGAYEAMLRRLFVLTGYGEEEAAEAASATLFVESQLAAAARSKVALRDIQANYNPMSSTELKKRCDAFDWDAYFAALGIETPETLIVGQPEVFDALNGLLRNLTTAQIRSYLAAHTLIGASNYLSDDFYAAKFDFYGRQLSGQQEPKPRWKRVMATTDNAFPMAVGKMYVEKYFPKEDKERMLTLVGNLRTALGEHIDALEWMSDETKVRAREKLATFHVKIGYPDTWKDYGTLTVDPERSYWENLKAVNAWKTDDELAKVGQPVDRDEWLMSPQTVNAYYNPTTNEICFPAAILQPPFYNSAADDAVNYGAIGVVIGHEMTHGFDDQGRNFDQKGDMNNWWTDADAAAFKAKTDILVEQFNKIEVLPARDGQPALYANGALSLGENIADQGGLRVSYTAYRNSLGGTEPAPVDGFTADQRFYIAYANLWAQNIREEEMARRTKMDVHSLANNRVNATLRNVETFYEAFGIGEGDPMFLPVGERVVIW